MARAPTPRRDDARRNREAILRVAGAAFTGGSRAVSLHEIARRAGLGRATVYRHFPDRHALAVAVAAEYLEALRRVVDGMERDGHSFRDVLHLVLSTQATMRPLAALMRELPEQDQRQHTEELIGILTPPLRRAQAAGQFRADVEPADLAQVLVMLDAAASTKVPGTAGEDDLQRLIAVILDGLFTTSAEAGDSAAADDLTVPDGFAAAGGRPGRAAHCGDRPGDNGTA